MAWTIFIFSFYSLSDNDSPSSKDWSSFLVGPPLFFCGSVFHNCGLVFPPPFFFKQGNGNEGSSKRSNASRSLISKSFLFSFPIGHLRPFLFKSSPSPRCNQWQIPSFPPLCAFVSPPQLFLPDIAPNLPSYKESLLSTQPLSPSFWFSMQRKGGEVGVRYHLSSFFLFFSLASFSPPQVNIGNSFWESINFSAIFGPTSPNLSLWFTCGIRNLFFSLLLDNHQMLVQQFTPHLFFEPVPLFWIPTPSFPFRSITMFWFSFI